MDSLSVSVQQEDTHILAWNSTQLIASDTHANKFGWFGHFYSPNTAILDINGNHGDGKQCLCTHQAIQGHS